VVAVATFGVVRLVTGRGNDDDPSTSATQPVGNTAATGTSLGPLDVLPECPTPQGADWIELDAVGQTAFGLDPVEWSYELRGGAARRLDGGGRQLILDLTATLGPRSPSSQNHYWWFYELAVGNAR
jgi:hypothetical protein